MADKLNYSPVDSSSSSTDDTTHSLLSQDEKDYMYEGRRPAQRRINFALKAILLLVVIVLHAGLVALVASWFGFTFPNAANSIEHGTKGSQEMHHGETCLMKDTYHAVHSIEGTPRDSYKDPTAEFLMTDPCGSTPEEARARGCRFGMLYGAWLPEACYDDESEQNFKKHTDWKFWLQPNRTEELSWDEVATGNYDYVLVEWEYHQRHCAEMNRKIFRSVSQKGLHTIDSYLSQWRHMDHCSRAAMIQKPYHELAGLLWRKFPDCGVIQWKKGMSFDSHHGVE